MNKLTVSVIGAIAGIALVLGVLSYNKTPEVVRGLSGSQGPRGEQGIQGPPGRDGKDGVTKVVTEVKYAEKVGAVSSPDIMSPYFSYGGVRNWGARRESLIQASSTICAIQGPAATSTLRIGAVRLNTSTTSATIIDMAKGTGPTATTTKVITTINLAANAQLTAVASSTLTSELLFAPNEWFVVNMVGATLGTSLNAPVGVCEAAWIEI